MGNGPVDVDAFDAFEAAGWEEKAAAYEWFFGVIAGRVVEPLLAAASVGVDTRVLDVATGPGGWTQAAERGASVVAVDVAEAMIVRARSAHPTLDFRRAGRDELPFADGSFDAVLDNFVTMRPSRPERPSPSAHACSVPAAGWPSTGLREDTDAVLAQADLAVARARRRRHERMQHP